MSFCGRYMIFCKYFSILIFEYRTTDRCNGFNKFHEKINEYNYIIPSPTWQCWRMCQCVRRYAIHAHDIFKIAITDLTAWIDLWRKNNMWKNSVQIGLNILLMRLINAQSVSICRLCCRHRRRRDYWLRRLRMNWCRCRLLPPQSQIRDCQPKNTQ